jgi:hypothetical protein
LYRTRLPPALGWLCVVRRVMRLCGCKGIDKALRRLDIKKSHRIVTYSYENTMFKF